METNIEKSRPKSKVSKKAIIISSVVIVLAAVFILPVVLKPKVKAVSSSAATVKNLTQSITVTGNIEANSTDRSQLSLTQKVTDVYVKEGDVVKKGDPIVKLDTSDLEYQLKKTQISLSALQVSNSSGARAADTAVKQAQVSYDTAQRNYIQLKSKFDSNQQLFDSGFISKDEYDSSKKAMDDAKGQLDVAAAQLDSANKSLAEYSKGSAQKQQLDQAKADIDNFNKKIKDSTITANIDGKVVKLDAVVNQYPKSDSNTVMVCDLSSYKVVVSLSQFDSVKVSKGQKANIRVKGLDKQYTGTVSKIGELADITMSGTNKESKVEVEITIDNPDENIRVGYEVDADIMLKEKPNTLAVDFESVKQDNSGKKYVFAIENNKAVKKYITTGLETDFDVEVVDGLKEGDKYILNPPEGLKEGENVVASGTAAGGKK